MGFSRRITHMCISLYSYIDPGPAISRFCTQEGAAVPRRHLVEIDTRPGPSGNFSRINNDKSESHLHSLSSDRDNACKAPASCSGPRTTSDLLGEALRGPRLLPWCIVLPLGTARREDATGERLCSPSAIVCCNHVGKQTVPPPDAASYAWRSTSLLVESVLDSQAADTDALVYKA